jgi:hypothetical protein
MTTRPPTEAASKAVTRTRKLGRRIGRSHPTAARGAALLKQIVEIAIAKRPVLRHMRPVGVFEVAPSREGDPEPKKAGRPSDGDATHNIERNHAIMLPVVAAFVKVVHTQ